MGYLQDLESNPVVKGQMPKTDGSGFTPGFDSFWGANSTSKPSQDTNAAQTLMAQNAGLYKDIKAPTLSQVSPQQVSAQQAQATNAGPSAMNNISVNPAYNQQQSAQMTALSNLAANGGRSAQSDMNLAQIQGQENANAKGQQGAIMANMNARGQGGSGASLLAQLSNSQNATDNQSMQDLGVQANQQNTALQAGQGAANIAGNMQNQSFNQQAQTAAANDAISKFNAGQTTGISQYNAGAGNRAQEFNAGTGMQGQEFNSGLGQTQFQDTMGIAGGQAGVNKSNTDYYKDKYKEDQAANGGILGGVTKIGAAAMAAAWGGKVPGTPVVQHNSTLNDIVPIHTSPGEAIVPRDLVAKGTPNQIGKFVKGAAPVGQDGKNREAMLSALKNIHSKRGGF